jgi:hypothetical protein
VLLPYHFLRMRKTIAIHPDVVMEVVVAAVVEAAAEVAVVGAVVAIK